MSSTSGLPDGDPWVEVGRRSQVAERLHAEGSLAEVPCPACGLPTLPRRGNRHVCVVCHWQDDGRTREQPDLPSTANRGLTLREATANVGDSGASVSRWDALVRPEYFAPAVAAARADLVTVYERLLVAPDDPEVTAAVRSARARVMHALVNLLR